VWFGTADYTPLIVEPDVSALCDFFVAKVALHVRLLITRIFEMFRIPYFSQIWPNLDYAAKIFPELVRPLYNNDDLRNNGEGIIGIYHLHISNF